MIRRGLAAWIQQEWNQIDRWQARELQRSHRSLLVSRSHRTHRMAKCPHLPVTTVRCKRP